jgi:hypothetical protein
VSNHKEESLEDFLRFFWHNRVDTLQSPFSKGGLRDVEPFVNEIEVKGSDLLNEYEPMANDK